MVKVNVGKFFGQEDNSEKKEEETVEEENWEENFKEHHDSRPRGEFKFYVYHLEMKQLYCGAFWWSLKGP